MANPTLVSVVTEQPSNNTPASNAERIAVQESANRAGLDITAPKDWKSIVDNALEEELWQVPSPALSSLISSRESQIIDSIASANPTINPVEKVAYDLSIPGSYFEDIRPPLQQVPNAVPMYVEMIDSNNKSCMFIAQDKTVIGALKLNPNPDSIVINSSKIVNRYNTMTRWVEEHWGDEIDTVTISGSSFSLMAFQPEDSPPGLSVINRNSTDPYLYLKALVNFYRTNGCLFQDNSYDQIVSDTDAAITQDASTRFLSSDPTFIQNHPLRGLIKERTYIKITLDYINFFGYFENFDLIEDSNSPYRLTYNITFKSERTRLLIGV